ncbi:MAG TPA: dTDP-4-amino-4,6-dideoxygalactose transaminase [Solirubrobacterales bacterium]|nr:dTDP-4-amino-4,6-dideoxygalactose transaminase [Solirubrobacterales bacterium]
MDVQIPFNQPYAVGSELGYVQEALGHGQLSGNGEITRRCAEWIELRCGCERALLTHSCTGALEMAALLSGVGPGDEVIMPSFTFPSTANAFALRGATCVFVDVCEETLNLDPERVREAVTARTKAIVPVHYSGVGCEMDALGEIAEGAGATVIEDAAQGILASFRGRALGSIGALGAFSFHETKTLSSGEGGALLVNDPALVERAEILLEKGTDRAAFFRGEIDKYTWRDLGSSFLMSEITAAFLWAQLESADSILARRTATWERYHRALAPLEAEGLLRRPVVPAECEHNGQGYWLLLPTAAERDRLLDGLRGAGVAAIFHYVPLHGTAAGRRFGRAAGDLARTDELAARMLRLPLWVGLPDADVDRAVAAVARELQASSAGLGVGGRP